MSSTKHFLYLAPLLLVCAELAHGGGVRMYGTGEVPEAGDVADILNSGAAANRPKMRGIRLESAVNSGGQMTSDLGQVAQPAESIVGLPVTFAFDSAELLPENEPQLDAVAEGIKLADGVTVLVEGHTDAHGSEAYNEELSRKRAEAVKEYLMQRHGISPSRLRVEGRGARAPLNEADPFAPENRRVQLQAVN